MEYFKRLLALLRLERAEDETEFKRLIAHASTQERRQSGLCWYPIAIRGQEMTRGDYLTVTLERTTHQDLDHVFQAGKRAELFSNHAPATDRIAGTVLHQRGNTLRLTLSTDELPEWARDGKLGVDILFDDESYDAMESAVKRAQDIPSFTETGYLISVLTGSESPRFEAQEEFVNDPELNLSQNQAVRNILEARDLAIVHGPPGTGKTTTLVAAIQRLVQQEKQPLLVIAPSNAAVDLLCEKLARQTIRVVRIGNPVRVSEALQDITLDQRMAAHPGMKEIKTLKKRAAEFQNMAHKYKRNFGPAEREQRKALFAEAHKLLREVATLEQYLIEDELSRAQVLAATPVGINHYLTRSVTFQTVLIDEAGQALEPACWIPILKARKVILAGDHCQLPPTIKSQEAARGGLELTLMEKCVAYHPEAVIMLQEQYRMHATIMGFSSQFFYKDQLKAHPSVAHRTLFPEDPPLSFIDTAGCGFQEALRNTSAYNTEEAAFLVSHLTNYLSVIAVDPAIPRPTIGVISPYKQQIRELQQQLEKVPGLAGWQDMLTVNTIDSFQGQERDVVYISLVRSNAKGEIGFLSDIRRMNVAMTRARQKLVVIGDSATLARSDFYAGFIDYAASRNAYTSAWELMDN